MELLLHPGERVIEDEREVEVFEGGSKSVE